MPQAPRSVPAGAAPRGSAVRERAYRLCGMLFAANFLVFWAVPIVVQGQAFHLGGKHALLPIYRWLDSSTTLRSLAARYVYTKPYLTDYAATALLALISIAAAFGTVLRYQLLHGTLPWWLCAAYNFAWVGFGGRVMGTAYVMTHKEGHNKLMYRPWIRRSVGNIFEVWIGILYGNVPYIFTTSHVHIHHQLDAGKGDTFYQWDLDRSSVWDFLTYVTRIFQHMVRRAPPRLAAAPPPVTEPAPRAQAGPASLHYFRAHNMPDKYNLLMRGCVIYWLVAPAVLGLLTASPWFLFVVWLQPLICMTFFLSIINWGFHAFIEFDESGKQVPCVNALTIVDGQDDYFGEDDHMVHHYSPQTWYTQTQTYHDRVMEDHRKYVGSVFKVCWRARACRPDLSPTRLAHVLEAIVLAFNEMHPAGSLDRRARRAHHLQPVRAARREALRRPLGQALDRAGA